jgi:hypothetical protein
MSRVSLASKSSAGNSRGRSTGIWWYQEHFSARELEQAKQENRDEWWSSGWRREADSAMKIIGDRGWHDAAVIEYDRQGNSAASSRHCRVHFDVDQV